jgi:hypothetical protein
MAAPFARAEIRVRVEYLPMIVGAHGRSPDAPANRQRRSEPESDHEAPSNVPPELDAHF